MKKNVKYITIIAMLSAIAGLLMIFEFPLPIFPSFIKLDFSDLPALIAAFSLGPIAGVLVELIKNFVNLLINGTTTGFIGEFANFFIGCALVVPAGIVYKFNKSKKGALLGMLIGTLCMAIFGGIANYFVLIPIYTKFIPIEAIVKMCSSIFPFINNLEKVILFSIVPFNLFKGILVSIITFFVYKRLPNIFKV